MDTLRYLGQVPARPALVAAAEVEDGARAARAGTARRIPRPAVVHNTDTDTTAAVSWERDRARVYYDLAGRPSIIVRADTNRMGDLWRLPVAAGGPLPVGATVRGGPAASRHVLGQIAGRRIRVTGVLRHPVTAWRFLSLLSPPE